jgi:hypothetical protein
LHENFNVNFNVKIYNGFLIFCKKRSNQLEHLFPAIFAIYFITEVRQACDAVKWTSHASHFSGLLGAS